MLETCIYRRFFRIFSIFSHWYIHSVRGLAKARGFAGWGESPLWRWVGASKVDFGGADVMENHGKIMRIEKVMVKHTTKAWESATFAWPSRCSLGVCWLNHFGHWQHWHILACIYCIILHLPHLNYLLKVSLTISCWTFYFCISERSYKVSPHVTSSEALRWSVDKQRSCWRSLALCLA